MEQLFLMPGEERCERFKEWQRYSESSLLLSLDARCILRLREPQFGGSPALCEDWLVGQDPLLPQLK